MNTYDVIIIGGGAAGMMAAIESGKKGNSTLLVEQNEKLGKKILVSGGGRCNFTNLYTSPENYLSNNRHFCKSALAQYTQWDFIDLLQQHKISYHEKEAGQLFCDESSRQIVNMLKAELVKASVSIKYKQTVKNVRHEKKLFLINSSDSEFKAKALIIATGGLSFPKLGSNSIGYQIAQSFGHSIIPTHPALVPLTFSEKEKELFSSLSGLSLDVEASAPKSRQSFKGKMLFTHRGISGPAILQVSSYLEHWQEIILNFDPENKFLNWLQEQKKTTPKQHLKTVLSRFFPKSFAWVIIKTLPLDKEIGKLTDLQMQDLVEKLHRWCFNIAGSEGYRTAEVTRGGINTDEISSKTMESKLIPNLYFAGEIIDVTGQLGGFNFQWAWSSGFIAGNAACRH